MRKPTVTLPTDYLSATNNLTLVAASARLARELRYAFDYEKIQANEKVWTRPQIQSYTQWLLSSYRHLGSRHPSLAFRSVVSNDTFLLIAQQQAPNEEVEMHASAIVDAWYLAWDANLWIDFKDIRTTENGQLCDDWFQRIRRCLDREKLITVAEIPELLQRAIERHDWRPQPIATYGFKDPSVASRNLFEAMARCDLYRDVTESPIRIESTTQRLHGFEKATEEFNTLALWSREKLSAYGSSATIGVVINGLSQSYPIVRRSFESIFPEVKDITRLVAIDSGQPLIQHRVYLDFINLLRWTCGSLDCDVLLQLAKSPYLPRLKLHRKPQKWFRERMTIREYRNRLPRAERSVLDRVVRVAPTRPDQPIAFADTAEAILELLRLCGYTAESKDEFAYLDGNAIKVLNDLVLRLARAAAIRPRISWRRFIDLVEIFAADQTISVARSEAPIQVMGRDASSNLRFDALWVTGVSDVDWPAVPRPNPFLPRIMQKRANLPGISHEQMLEDARVLTNHWRTSSTEVVFSYVSQIDKVAAQPSNLFADLSSENDAEDGASIRSLVEGFELIEYGHPWSTFSVSGVIHEYQQPYGSKVAPENVKARTKLLRDQAHCPFKGWAVHRARLSETETPLSRFPTAAQRGSLFHYVVAEILAGARTQAQLERLNEDTLLAAIDKVLEESDESKTLPARFLRHERVRLKRWINEWLTFQVQRREPFEVLDVEKEVELEIKGLKFRGYIDRIDRTDSMERIIIDHKTGPNYLTKNWDPELMSDPQMPMYATAVEACDGLAYLSIYRTSDGLKCRWQGIGTSTQPEVSDGLDGSIGNFASLTELKDAWRKRLTEIVTDHLDGKADVEPVQDDVCRFCHLSNLCRVYEDPTLNYVGGDEE